jgi:hypothetical protein
MIVRAIGRTGNPVPGKFAVPTQVVNDKGRLLQLRDLGVGCFPKPRIGTMGWRRGFGVIPVDVIAI